MLLWQNVLKVSVLEIALFTSNDLFLCIMYACLSWLMLCFFAWIYGYMYVCHYYASSTYNLLYLYTSHIYIPLYAWQATSIPPHNLQEVCRSVIAIVKNSSITDEVICWYVLYVLYVIRMVHTRGSQEWLRGVILYTSSSRAVGVFILLLLFISIITSFLCTK